MTAQGTTILFFNKKKLEMAGNSEKVVFVSYNDFNKIVSILQKQNQPNFRISNTAVQDVIQIWILFSPKWNPLVDLTED